MLFYIPRKLWKSFEGGLMESFGKDAKNSVLLPEECDDNSENALYREAVARNMLIFFTALYTTTTDTFYSFSYVSCTFHSVGTAAGEQKFNSLCVLSLNIINEKIYVLLWFWLFGVTIATAIHLFYRLAVIMMPHVRPTLLMMRARTFKPEDSKSVRRILARCYLGDWWVLYQIGRNSNTHFFRYLLRYIDCKFTSIDKAESSVDDSLGGRAYEDGSGSENGKPRKRGRVAMPYVV
ncbi:inx [Lepeophtheirus salmonis]|uniref:Innexin n=1 Tax=Lepeophtheirus salmonis TaxID=72036 RepID=A0A7R8H1J4_LEPSM|nr:inx [Lepeophtheirus salmonis]CAF2794981.1 inx [Lepeophtheirus salmonis]